MKKMSKLITTVAVFGIASVIGRSVGYFSARLLTSDNSGSSSVTASETADSTAASDNTSEIAIATPATDSLLIEHRVFQTVQNAESPEYILVFYESGSRKLVQINDETLFYKSAGYTLESVQSVDVSQIYPGAENFDFMTKEVTDEGDYIKYVLAFNNLENYNNLKSLDQTGLIVLDDGFAEGNYVNADTLCQSMSDNGSPELKLTEMPDSLTYTVN